MKNQPKRNIKLTPYDYILEVAGIITCIAVLVLTFYYYNLLPDTIPRHYNFSGQPDAFAEKWIIYTLPVIGIILYSLLTIINKFPHIFNYLVTITDENAVVQYKIATRMIRILKTIIILTFLYISHTTISIALNDSGSLNAVFLPIFLILVIGSVAYYVYQSFKYK